MKALQEKKISIGKLSYEQSDMPEGFVISASVKEGETLAEKIDKVDLVISLGNPNAKVPDAETDDTSEGEENTGAPCRYLRRTGLFQFFPG